MKLLSLKGRNIGLLKGDFEFEFDEAMTVITGPIGCGKSTTLTMIRASLTNAFPGTALSWASWGVSPLEACYFVVTWRIGDKVLHIAKCVAGEKAFTALKIPRLRIEYDDGNVEELYGSKESLEKTHSFIPVPASIIDGHLIVDQDSITAPVASTPAKFKEIIHTLTRTSELETIRSQARDVLMSVTVPDVQGPLQEAQAELALLQGEYNRLEAEIQASTAAYVILDMPTVLLQLDTLDLLKKNDDRRTKLDTQHLTAVQAISQLESQLTARNEDWTSMLAQKEATKTAAEEAKKSLYSADATLIARKRIEFLQIKASQLSKDLQVCIKSEPVAPNSNRLNCTRELEEEMTAKIGDANQRYKAAKHKLELAEQGQCPQCGNSTSLCAADLELLNKEAEDIKGDVALYCYTTLAIKSGIKEWETYDKAIADYHTCVMNTMTKSEETSQELDSLKDTPEMTPEIKTGFTKVASAYDTLERSISSIENSISALQGHLQSQTDMLDVVVKELADIPVARFDGNEYARLTKICEDGNSIKQQVGRLEGNLDGTEKSLERAKQKVIAQELRAASVKPIERFRSILERVNQVLMKDGLPRLLSLQYMGKLNERLAFYLDTIHADFTAAIDENLEFTVRKADGMIHHAKRLSGGQKQQASVCYLLAVNDVFASTLGVLALDEPSGAMQESNSRDLAEAFNYLAKMGLQTGRQFIVITHSTSLAAYGCKHIALEGK